MLHHHVTPVGKIEICLTLLWGGGVGGGGGVGLFCRC